MGPKLLVYTVGAAALCGAWMLLVGPDPFRGRAFDRAVWARGVSDAQTAMAKDIVTNVVTPGMTRGQVEDLLGHTRVLKGTMDAGNNRLLGKETLIYRLKSSSRASMLGKDSAFIYVHLNDAGKVIGAEIAGY